VLRLTRGAGLLAPTAKVRKRAKRLHDGTITVTVPDTLWATDATEAHTRQEGRCAVFAIVDHASGEIWVDACGGSTAGLLLTCSGRSAASASAQSSRPSPMAWRCAMTAARAFRSAHYQAEIDHLAISRSPAYHYEPQTNGCVEKFNQTLKQQVLWIERFDTLDELRTPIRQFAEDFNEHWLLERHGYRTPRQAAHAMQQAAMA
jgi:putative transposase